MRLVIPQIDMATVRLGKAVVSVPNLGLLCSPCIQMRFRSLGSAEKSKASNHWWQYLTIASVAVKRQNR
jgi:hypothetical protein